MRPYFWVWFFVGVIDLRGVLDEMMDFQIGAIAWFCPLLTQNRVKLIWHTIPNTHNFSPESSWRYMHHFHLGFWGFSHPRVNPVFIHSIDNASIVLRCWWDQSSTPTNHKTSSLAAHGIAHVFVSFLVACGRLAKNGHVSNQGEAMGKVMVPITILWYPTTLSTQWLELGGTCEIKIFKVSWQNTFPASLGMSN